MAEENKPAPKSTETIINANTIIGSQYSQIARVTVTDFEITIEFAYIQPADPTQGQSIARITMPIPSAIGLAETILQIKKIHEKKKEGKKND